MAKTSQLELPLVMPAQAQKHVTVNEALVRLDAAVQLRVRSSSIVDPPVDAPEGAAYLIAGGASGEWGGKSLQIAIWSNGGWTYLAPKSGWRAWDEEAAAVRIFDGSGWVADAVAVSANGAGLAWVVTEFDHSVIAGQTNTITSAIRAGTQILGLTGRVVERVTGAGITGWRIGVAGSDNRYGSGLGTVVNSQLIGLTGAPLTYYAATPVLLTAEGGSFDAGVIRIAVHYLRLDPPRLV